MKPTLCYRCNDYREIPGEDAYVLAYSKPVQVAMIPVYVSKKVEGSQNKRKWQRVGLLCPRCKDFCYSENFKPGRHAV